MPAKLAVARCCALPSESYHPYPVIRGGTIIPGLRERSQSDSADAYGNVDSFPRGCYPRVNTCTMLECLLTGMLKAPLVHSRDSPRTPESRRFATHMIPVIGQYPSSSCNSKPLCPFLVGQRGSVRRDLLPRRSLLLSEAAIALMSGGFSSEVPLNGINVSHEKMKLCLWK